MGKYYPWYLSLILSLMFMYSTVLTDRKSLPRSELQKGGILRCLYKTFKYSWHTILYWLYYFQVYNIVIRYFYTLQCDHPINSSIFKRSLAYQHCLKWAKSLPQPTILLWSWVNFIINLLNILWFIFLHISRICSYIYFHSRKNNNIIIK